MPAMSLEKTRLPAGFLILLLINGCSSLPKLSDTLPPAVELADTPFFPQEEHQCGPAALATVLNYHGRNITPDELTPQIFLPGRKGSLQIEIAAAARRYGMLAYPLGENLNDLFAEVAAGNPVLVLQNLAFGWLPKWHYAVVIGYDLTQHEVILRSGRQRRWRSKLSAYNNTWSRSENWALVILPANQIPVTATPKSFLRAAYDLEATEQHDAALSAYRAASVRWPDDKRTWLALGNSAFKLNQFEQAHEALRQAISIDPADPTVFNNLAYIYLAAGCAAQARESIRHALELQPENQNLLDSKQEIDSKSSRLKDDECRLTESR